MEGAHVTFDVQISSLCDGTGIDADVGNRNITLELDEAFQVPVKTLMTDVGGEPVRVFEYNKH